MYLCKRRRPGWQSLEASLMQSHRRHDQKRGEDNRMWLTPAMRCLDVRAEWCCAWFLRQGRCWVRGTWRRSRIHRTGSRFVLQWNWKGPCIGSRNAIAPGLTVERVAPAQCTTSSSVRAVNMELEKPFYSLPRSISKACRRASGRVPRRILLRPALTWTGNNALLPRDSCDATE